MKSFKHYYVMTDSALGFWYFFEGLPVACCLEAGMIPQMAREPPPLNRPSHQAQVCKQSRWALRPGRRRAGAEYQQFAESLLLSPRQYLQNSLKPFFSSETANCIREPSFWSRKRVFPSPHRECVPEWGLGLRYFLANLGWRPPSSTAKPVLPRCQVVAVAKSEGAPWKIMPRVL